MEEKTILINNIKRKIALKQRMHKDFLKPHGCRNQEEFNKRIRYPMEKFNDSEVIIMSIYDTAYPYNTLLEKDFTGYFKAEIYNFYHNGLIVIIGIKEIKVKSIGVINACKIGYLPFKNIIDYDYKGDEYYRKPILYCDFVNKHDPFEKIGYADEFTDGYQIIDDDHILLTEDETIK